MTTPAPISRPASSPRRDSATGLKAQIVEVATRSFADKGYAATSIRELVDACGCTKPALYYHFGSKEGLFRAIVEAELERIAGFMTAPRGETLRERMKAVLIVFVEYAEAHPHSMQLLHRVETRPEPQTPDLDMAGFRAAHLEVVRALIAEGQATGEVRGDADPMDCALALTGAINFQLMLWHAGDPLETPRLHRIVDLFFEGIGS